MKTIPAKEVVDSLPSQLPPSEVRAKQTYAQVSMINFFWEDGDIGFKEEAEALKELLETKFSYDVTNYAIPSQGCQWHVHRTIADVMAHSTSEQLLIIHYGGHGIIRDNDAIWLTDTVKEGLDLNTQSFSVEINWSHIQEWLVQNVVDRDKHDALLILDCCSAAAAMRSRNLDKSETGRFEIIAATTENGKTPMPGDKSFTFMFMKRLDQILDSQKSISAKDLVRDLTDRKNFGLWAQPLHIEKRTNRLGPIFLQPLWPAPRPNFPKKGVECEVVLRLDELLSEEDQDKLYQWVRAAPLTIQSIRSTSILDQETIYYNSEMKGVMPGLSHSQPIEAGSIGNATTFTPDDPGQQSSVTYSRPLDLLSKPSKDPTAMPEPMQELTPPPTQEPIPTPKPTHGLTPTPEPIQEHISSLQPDLHTFIIQDHSSDHSLEPSPRPSHNLSRITSPHTSPGLLSLSSSIDSTNQPPALALAQDAFYPPECSSSLPVQPSGQASAPTYRHANPENTEGFRGKIKTRLEDFLDNGKKRQKVLKLTNTIRGYSNKNRRLFHT